MKYISIIFSVILISLVSCTREIVDPNESVNVGSKVTVSIKSLASVTKSEDTDAESMLAWVDVYVMNEDYSIYYSERFGTPDSPLAIVGNSKFTLAKGRDEFPENKRFYVYVIANSQSPICNSWEQLRNLTQKDENLHLTAMGIDNTNPLPPLYFLMDGYAYVGSVDPLKMVAQVINDGTDNDSVLNGVLSRAASKVIVNIFQGESVEFRKTLENATPLYSFYQLPISTLVVDPARTGERHVSEKQTTGEWGIDPKNFSWSNDEYGNPTMRLIGYAYANDWSSKQATNETSLMLSIPMMWDADGNAENGKEKSSPVNWYKVPVSKESKFERNTCYVVNVKINAIGAEEKNVPIELKDVEYETLPWVTVGVGVNNEIPRYLTLNTDLVKIYDQNFDFDQLRFTSSSPIKSIKLKDVYKHNDQNDVITALELKEESDGYTDAVYEGGDGCYVYYVDKFGKLVQLGTDPGFDIHVVEKPSLTKEQILHLENNLYRKEGSGEQYIRAVVPDEFKRSLNGDIHIYSPINAVAGNEELNWDSHFNTVRYMEFEVMNEQGLTATFRVEQTPVTVIRNLEGFFSYRSDFRIGDSPVQFNADAFTSTVGKIKPVDQGPIHYLNPASPFFVLAGFLPYHAHEVNEDGVMLVDNCNSSYKGYEELLYGFMERNYHKSYSFGGPIEGVFHRDHYDDINGNPVPSDATLANGNNKYYQAFGLVYDDPKTGSSFRRHYTGNFFETFWAKVVGEVYDEDVILEYPIIRTDVQICRYCMENKSTNPNGKPYILATECPYYPDKSANHKKKYVTGYPCKVGTRTVKVPKGQAGIYKLSPTDYYDSWEHYSTAYYFGKPREKSSTSWYFPSYEYPEAMPSFYNHRMYHVRVTATSDDYTVAAPSLMDENGNPTYDRERGYTMESADNARLVSPSFMVASQLGESILPTQEHNYVMPGIEGFYYYAKRQCQEYVETRYDDRNGNGRYDAGEPVYHYNDWRLPTKAEIDYIIKHQETSRAMDKVMYAQYYYIAATEPGVYTEGTVLSNQVPNYDSNYTGWYMRCVRDAFKEPEPVIYDANYNVVSGN